MNPAYAQGSVLGIGLYNVKLTWLQMSIFLLEIWKENLNSNCLDVAVIQICQIYELFAMLYCKTRLLASNI